MRDRMAKSVFSIFDTNFDRNRCVLKIFLKNSFYFQEIIRICHKPFGASIERFKRTKSTYDYIYANEFYSYAKFYSP